MHARLGSPRLPAGAGSVRAAGLRAAVLAIVGAGLLLAAGLGWCAPTHAAGAEPVASIRAAVFSPGMSSVDVSLTSFAGTKTRLQVSNAAYALVSRYASVSAGLYVVTIRPHGAGLDSAPLLSWDLRAEPGQAYTVAIVGSAAAMRGTVLRDDLAAPKLGWGRLRVIQAASAAPTVQVRLVHGPALASYLTFTTSSGYTQVKAGTWQVAAHSISQPGLSIDATLSIRAGTVSSILLLDAPSGGLTMRAVLDAEAARPARGAVPAGGGGMAAVVSAPPAHNEPWPLRPAVVGALAGVVGTVLVGAAVRRRYRTPGT
jgi:Domain of unknown function (DUF4397)